MRLTKNFTLDEMTRTTTGAVNAPDMNQSYNLLMLATYLLQPIRDKFGPIQINSGFRSRDVNEALKSKGYPVAQNSQHMAGQAADISPLNSTLEDVFNWARGNLSYGQLILEKQGGRHWIHISLPRFDGENQMTLLYNDGKYQRL